MIPTIAAAGRGQYAKALRFTLEQFLKFSVNTKAFFYCAKYHTVKYTWNEWCGIWSDLCIKQTLMRWVKSIGGLVGGCMRTESYQKLWLLTISKFAAIHQLLED